MIPCPSCARHIRLTEARCPFCGATCPDPSVEAAVPMPPRRGLGRADRHDHARTAARAAGAVGSGVAIAFALGCCDNGGVLYGGPPPGWSPRGPDAAPGDTQRAEVRGAPPEAAPRRDASNRSE